MHQQQRSQCIGFGGGSICGRWGAAARFQKCKAYQEA